MVSPIIKQTWTVSAVIINYIGLGMNVAFPSCLVPALMAPDSPIKVDLDTASWLTSGPAISTIFGYFASAIVMDWRGRRFAHMLLIIPGGVGWLVIYFSKSVTSLMIGRILRGFTGGATITLGAVVIGEYSCPKYRGVFLNLKTTALCIGTTTMHMLGHYFHWRTVALISLIPFVITIAIIYTWTESPSWLASKNSFKKSEEAFYYLRGRNDNSVKEIEALIWAQKERLSSLPQNLTGREKLLGFLMKFRQKDFLKPMLIIIFCHILIEACGRHSFPAYILMFLDNLKVDKTQSFHYTIAIDIIITLSAMFSCYLVKIMKRRTLLFFSGLASVFLLVCIIIYLTLAESGLITDNKSWLPLGMLVIYFIVVNFGCTAIPLALFGELFPLAHRSAGASVTGLIMSLIMFVFLKTTPAMIVSIKVYGTFSVYAIAMVIALLYMYFYLPETKDRTLQEIEDFFNHGSFLDDECDKKQNVKTELIQLNSS